MSFEMKYDRNGNPLGQKQVEPTPQPVVEVAEAVELSTQEQESVVDNMSTAQTEESSVDILSTEEEIQQEEKAPTRTTKPTPAESWKELKAAKEREERERQRFERENIEYARRIKELEAASQPQKAMAPEEDLNININPDDLVEGKHLSKVGRKIQELEKKLEQYERKAVTQTIQSQLRTQFPDFDKIVSQDHLAQLQQTEPELYSTLNASNDLYSTGVSAYKMIKKLGIAQTEQYQEDTARIQKNAAKPRTAAALNPQMSDSPLTKVNAFANGLTKEVKEQLYREMTEAQKRM